MIGEKKDDESVEAHYVDVRDVARIQVESLRVEEAENQRSIWDHGSSFLLSHKPMIVTYFRFRKTKLTTYPRSPSFTLLSA